MHGCACGEAGHAAPPLAAGRVTVNDCDWIPPPHALLHALKLDHTPWQSSGGQAWVWHAWVLVKTAGQATPPLAACSVMVYICD